MWEALLRGVLTTDLLDAAELAGVQRACVPDAAWSRVAAGGGEVIMRTARAPPRD